MGVNIDTARFLIEAKNHGVTFDKMATIGRSTLFVSPDEINDLITTYGASLSGAIMPGQTGHSFADDFFRILGANDISSIDISGYEGANILHDMNQPIPGYLTNSFDVVYDGGSLEHVFNLPQGLKNCMEMVKVGGHLIIETIANNVMGHGFYQFSPELFYRCLSPANGFQVERMIIYEMRPDKKLYNVIDPNDLKCRVELCNRFPTFLYVQSRRVALQECFAQPPQQSDYEICWSSGVGDVNRQSGESESADLRGKVRKYIPGRAFDFLRYMYHIKYLILRGYYKRPFMRSYYKELK
jgi:hypothetical protein